jgi:hypothetical protein
VNPAEGKLLRLPGDYEFVKTTHRRMTTRNAPSGSGPTDANDWEIALALRLKFKRTIPFVPAPFVRNAPLKA